MRAIKQNEKKVFLLSEYQTSPAKNFDGRKAGFGRGMIYIQCLCANI